MLLRCENIHNQTESMNKSLQDYGWEQNGRITWYEIENILLDSNYDVDDIELD